MKKNTMLAIGAALLSVLISADECSPQQPVTAVEQQRAAAQKQAASEQTYCYECKNILGRRILFGKPGVIGYVALLNQAGQPVMYVTVNGKCSSAKKRLTPVQEVTELPYRRQTNGASQGDSSNTYVTDAQGEDGVYGTSEDYIYCFGTDGRYIQWSGQYLYSDKPFDLTIKPLIIDVGGKTKVSGQ